MKRLGFAVMLVITGSVHAANPDGDLSLSAGFAFDLTEPSETARYQYGGSLYQGNVRQLNGYGLGASLVGGMGDAVSGRLFGGSGSYESEFTESKLSGTLGMLRQRTVGQDSYLGLGLRLYPSAFFMGSYDPLERMNPDGFVRWPYFNVSIASHAGEEKVSTPLHDGAYAATVVTSSLRQTYFDAFYSVVVPVAHPLSLSLGYGRQFNRSLQLTTPALQISQNDDGVYESLAGTLSFFARLKALPTSGPVIYLPHVGFPGMLRGDFRYSQVYNLAAQEMSTRSYDGSFTYVLDGGIGLSVDYGFQEVEFSNFNSGDITEVNEWSQSLGFRVSMGWNSWVRADPNAPKEGADMEVPKPESAEPVKEVPLTASPTGEVSPEPAK